MKLTKEIRKEIANDIHAIKQKIAENLARIITEIENPTENFEPEEFEEMVIPDWRKKGEFIEKNIGECNRNLGIIKDKIKAWETIAKS